MTKRKMIKSWKNLKNTALLVKILPGKDSSSTPELSNMVKTLTSTPLTYAKKQVPVILENFVIAVYENKLPAGYMVTVHEAGY